MKLNPLVKYHLKQPDFSKYLTNFKPSLDIQHLEIIPTIGKTREETRCVLEGENGLGINYKRKPGAYMTMNETEGGDVWNVLQVQGARSNKSYRVASGIHWPFALAHTLDDLAKHPEAEVRHIIMPPLHSITNLDEARSEYIDGHYKDFRTALQMAFSKQEGLYIRDISRKK